MKEGYRDSAIRFVSLVQAHADDLSQIITAQELSDFGLYGQPYRDEMIQAGVLMQEGSGKYRLTPQAREVAKRINDANQTLLEKIQNFPHAEDLYPDIPNDGCDPRYWGKVRRAPTSDGYPPEIDYYS